MIRCIRIEITSQKNFYDQLMLVRYKCIIVFTIHVISKNRKSSRAHTENMRFQSWSQLSAHFYISSICLTGCSLNYHHRIQQLQQLYKMYKRRVVRILFKEEMILIFKITPYKRFPNSDQSTHNDSDIIVYCSLHKNVTIYLNSTHYYENTSLPVHFCVYINFGDYGEGSSPSRGYAIDL